ncbi:MAG: hypothetical protein ACK4MW_00295 [Aquificaceae bacterium]
MSKAKIFVLLLFGFLVSCASVVSTGKVNIPKSSTFAVLPFENNTETPLAGLRVASITEGVAVSKGYNIKAKMYGENKEYTSAEIQNMIKELKERGDIDYVITGSVNEFRYKTGIDGEPAVSITLKIYDLKEDKFVLVNTGSRTGWSHESVGTVAQKILQAILP